MQIICSQINESVHRTFHTATTRWGLGRCTLASQLSSALYSLCSWDSDWRTFTADDLHVHRSTSHDDSITSSMISEKSGKAQETSFLYQRISILVQHFNAVLLH